jgi:hypothetical protein
VTISKVTLDSLIRVQKESIEKLMTAHTFKIQMVPPVVMKV